MYNIYMQDNLNNIEDEIVKDKNIRSGHGYRNRKKPAIKFMIITRFGNNSQRHDITFLTNDTKFYYTSLRFKQYMHHISYIHHNKIRAVFKNFDINENTEIIVQDTIDTFCPLMIYFDIIRPHIKFQQTRVPLVQMVKRIYYRHLNISKRVHNGTAKITEKNVTIYLNNAWDKLVDLDVCPWITKSVNDKFKLLSDKEVRHQIRARICLYYMIVRRYLMNKNKKCFLNKMQQSI